MRVTTIAPTSGLAPCRSTRSTTSRAPAPSATTTSSTGAAASASSACSSNGRPSSSASCLGRPILVDPPAARTSPTTVTALHLASFSQGVDRLPALRQAPARAAVAGGDHLGKDRDGRLLGRLGADVQADRPGDAGQLIIAVAVLAEPLQALAVGAAAAHRADVGDRAAQQGAEGGIVEARLVREHAGVGGVVGRVGRQVLVRP